MKKYLLIIFLLSISCKDSLIIQSIPNEISIQTNKISYSSNEGIEITIRNTSEREITIGLRANQFLEIAYQKSNLIDWSELKEFWFMQLMAPTFLDTIKSNSQKSYILNSNIFPQKGIYRFSFRHFNSVINEVTFFYSYSFEVK